MKKATIYIICIIAALLMLSMCACDSGKPEKMSDQHYEYGCKALDIIDQYLDNVIDAETANRRLDNLRNFEESKLPKTEVGDPSHSQNLYVELDVSHASYTLFQVDFGTGSQSELLKSRNKLATDIGKDTK